MAEEIVKNEVEETKEAAKASTKTKKTDTAKKETAKKETTKKETVKKETAKKETTTKKSTKKVAPKAEKKIKVTLVKSTIGSTKDQIATVQALGLRKINSFNIIKDNAASRGMVEKVKHLIKVCEA